MTFNYVLRNLKDVSDDSLVQVLLTIKKNFHKTHDDDDKNDDDEVIDDKQWSWQRKYNEDKNDDKEEVNDDNEDEKDDNEDEYHDNYDNYE